MRITEQESREDKGLRVVITDLNTGEELYNEKTKLLIAAFADEKNKEITQTSYLVGRSNLMMKVALAALSEGFDVVSKINREKAEAEKDKPCSLDELKADILKDALKAILEGDL